MDDLNIRYWSHGPHYQFRDSIVFITWRLTFTLPAHILELFKELRSSPGDAETKRTKEQMKENDIRMFNKFLEYDAGLASFQHPGFSLNDSGIAEIVKQAFHFYDGKRYDLHAYCVMSNHVHVLLRPLQKVDGYHPIHDIVKSVKRYTAYQINKLLGKTGQVWDDFYFDRIIRDSRNYDNVVRYILMNPVAAGLVQSEDEWRDSYRKLF